MSETAHDTSLALANALEQRAVPYAIGGALACGVWGVPRATLDVDVNVFVDETVLAPTLKAIRSIGGRVDSEQAEIGAKLNGMFAAQHGPFLVRAIGFSRWHNRTFRTPSPYPSWCSTRQLMVDGPTARGSGRRVPCTCGARL